jgi:uncharacterized membrane protein
MSYDFHPILVHFPIALLLLYSGLRLVAWPKKFPPVDWRFPRISILILGLLGAWAASASGEIASELNNHNETILEAHELFAGLSTNIYTILIILEILALLNIEKINHPHYQKIKTILCILQKKLSSLWILSCWL